MIARIVLEVAQAALALLLAPGSGRAHPLDEGAAAEPTRGPGLAAVLRAAEALPKEVVVSSNASWLFRAAPFIVLREHRRGDIPRADPRGAAAVRRGR